MNGRGPYEGVLNILTFNQRFYVRTTAACFGVLIAAALMPVNFRVWVGAATLPALFWMASSLAVSHFVYDRSPLYRFGWLDSCLSLEPRSWVNIHAGLDESTPQIRRRFPFAQGETIDIYDPREMMEPSIARAREVIGLNGRLSPVLALPSRAEWDAVFLIFVAHELRRREARVRLFRAIERGLSAGGEVVVVEHLRDWACFLAFGPGALHFFSRRVWRDTWRSAGLAVSREMRLTPFVRAFVLRSAVP